MKHSFFVSGIGTDVGKTIVSSVLCELLFANYWKPVQSGELDNTDSMKVEGLVSFETFNYFPEQFRLTQPLSPHVSAKLDGVHIEATDFTFPEFTGNLIVEGAGGLMVPINENGLLYCDLAAAWKLPTILISRHYLGSINHTLMSIETLRNRNIPILGINYGRLGFLASISKDELSLMVDALVNRTYVIDKRALIHLDANIPIFGTTHADHLTKDIPCAPPMDDSLIEGNYEHNTGIQILDCFKEKQLSYEEVEMVLIGNHGPFAWGKTAAKAVYNSKVLEVIAEMAHFTLQINPNAPRLKDSLIKKHYERKHGKDSYYGQ